MSVRLSVLALSLCFLFSAYACQSSELKKLVQEKDQKIAVMENELKKAKDEFSAKEQDLKAQSEQRIAKLTSTYKHQIDALNAKLADYESKGRKDSKAKKSRSN